LRAQSPRLAASLLLRRSAALTKAELLLLCAHWRLKSDRWRRRGNRPARPPPEPAAVVERPLFPPPLRLDAPESLHAAAVWAHIGAVLRPLALRCGPLLSGPGAAARAARDPAAARLYRHELALVRATEADFGARHFALPSLQLNVHAAEQRLPASAAAAPAAACALPPAVRAVPTLVALGLRHVTRLRDFEARRLAEPGNGEAELTWLQEVHAGHASTAELLQQVGALLAASLRASEATHVAVASMLLDLILTKMGANFNAFAQRRKWLEALPDDEGGDAGGDAAARKPLMPPVDEPSLLANLPAGCFQAIAAQS
jgi:hypothetical protein